MMGSRERLARRVRIQQYRLREACRDLLEGPDTPGRRWLVVYLQGDAEEAPPESLGFATSDYFRALIEPIRKQLIAEYPGLFQTHKTGDKNGDTPKHSTKKTARDCGQPE